MSSDVALRDSAGGGGGAEEARVDAAARNFVNYGLQRWERMRKVWLAGDSGEPVGRRRSRARMMDVDEVIDDLFSGGGGTGNLPYSVPLPQMIDLLVDLWEAEGLFD